MKPVEIRFVVIVLTTMLLIACGGPQPRPALDLVQYGSMHETIGQQRHHGRVPLAEIVQRPHFYGVGALEGLEGEITIHDSGPIVTGVTSDGGLHALPHDDRQATLLVGQFIEDWTSHEFDEAVTPDGFDEAVAVAAEKAGLDPRHPFVFVLEGEVRDVLLHVINGSCPIRARVQNVMLDESERPVELDASALRGRVVGVYARDAVGKLTHPATSVHAHLVFGHDETGERMTGHLERLGAAKGAVLRLPAVATPPAR